MNDDGFDNVPDAQNNIPDPIQENLGTDHSALGASMNFVPDGFNHGGGNIFDGGNKIASITPNAAIPGSFHMQTLGSMQNEDMGTIFDGNDLNLGNVDGDALLGDTSE